MNRKVRELGDPFVVTGSLVKGELNMRHFDVLIPTGRGIIESYPKITGPDLEQAAVLAQRLNHVADARGNQNWRLRRCLSIYLGGRISLLDRLHQFVRFTEDFIVSGQGEGMKKFKS